MAHTIGIPTGVAASGYRKPPPPSYFTGGIVADEVVGATTYRTHRFNSSGTLTYVGIVPVNVEYLAVAGGGGGGYLVNNSAGGGGGGGVRSGTASLSANQTVVVGAGGPGALVSPNDGVTGSNTSLGATTSLGGGGGGGVVNSAVGLPGASGGGGASTAGTGGAGTAGQGFAGGLASVGGGATNSRAAGGGGGAGAAGGDATLTAGGAGGDGVEWPAASGVRYGGGGGGCTGGALPAVAPGGAGGGGAGGRSTTLGIAGAGGTGGGGGAGANGGGAPAGFGGSGTVIVRYVRTPEMPPITNALPPQAIAGLVGWWDAADTATVIAPNGDGLVSTWADKATNGRPFTQAAATSQPLTGVRTINGRNVLYFDQRATHVTMVTATFSPIIPQPWTGVIVCESAEVDTNTRTSLSGAFRVSAGNFELGVNGVVGAPSNALPNIHIGYLQGPTSSYYINGALVVPAGTGGVTGLGSLRIGNTTVTTSWLGTIAEVIYYDHLLTEAERTGLEAHLKAKWGIT